MNCRIIALIPVGKKADKIQKYIPICLLMWRLKSLPKFFLTYFLLLLTE
jgi:hypothetical protein